MAESHGWWRTWGVYLLAWMVTLAGSVSVSLWLFSTWGPDAR